ncbi:hypothetical protein [Limnoglobus roseus]|uniref:hypothetical protein n=1 Tax=Limnoglobus roseus TaxID=2598579 RepID=UPI001C49B8A7|nr:hypothetical protein [Limnoglobus roseus]
MLGSACQFSRPASGVTPTVWTDPVTHTLNNPLFCRYVSLNAEDMKYSKPNKYGKATWYALVDGCGLQPGDYFVGSEGTFFVAALQALLPILVVECNRTVTLSRVPRQTAVGAVSYSGMTQQNETPYVSGVPCSILQGTKGEKNEADLPGDVRLPWWVLLMPASVGTVLYGDLIVDDLGKRYIASSVELTDLGYRITAMQANT